MANKFLLFDSLTNTVSNVTTLNFPAITINGVEIGVRQPAIEDATIETLVETVNSILTALRNYNVIEADAEFSSSSSSSSSSSLSSESSPSSPSSSSYIEEWSSSSSSSSSSESSESSESSSSNSSSSVSESSSSSYVEEWSSSSTSYVKNWSSSSSSSYLCCTSPSCSGNSCKYFSNWSISGANQSNTDNCILYLGLGEDPAGTEYVRLYKSSSRDSGSLVAQGSKDSAGSITLTEQNASGLSGSVTWGGVYTSYPNCYLYCP